jgi:outer membrane protein TolC
MKFPYTSPAIRVLLLGTAAVVILATPCPATAETERPVVTVGVIFDGDLPAGQDSVLVGRRQIVHDEVKRQTLALTRRELDVRFPDDKLLIGDWTREGIGAAVDRLLADPEVDVVVSLGPFATQELGLRGDLPKPAIAAWVLDVEAQRIPFDGNSSGVRNLSYLTHPGSIQRDLRKFCEIIRCSSIDVLIDAAFERAIPEVPATVAEGARRLGIGIRNIGVGTTAEEALATLGPETEAVYITPLLRMSTQEFDKLVAGLIERRLPTFSLLGEVEVRRGVMGGLRTQSDLDRVARRIALNVQRVLAGEEAGSLPVLIDQPQKLMINMATAQAIARYPRWRVMIEAELIHDTRRQAEQTLSLSEAVQTAVDANVALLATRRVVVAGVEDIRRARASFRPRIDASAGGLLIDEDRAESSFGSQPEESLSGGIGVSQLLWSDSAAANVDISRELQRSLEQEEEILRLDVALAAATAFLDVLRAETLERVEAENLRLTESNLEISRRRREIGASGPAEVYRWESELATDRATVIAARNRVDIARVQLNRVLHRPQEESFEAVAPSIADPNLVTGFGRLMPYIDDSDAFSVFREFSVVEGLHDSPELRSIDAALAAQERARLAAQRSYWSPDVALVGDVERRFSESGAGSSSVSIPGGPAGPDRDSWSVALQATFPIFTGGARKADAIQTSEELAGLRLEREDVRERVEQRVRTAMFRAASTYVAIELSAEAAEAARKNLELVSDSYSRGVVSILDLLDAQNAALVAEQFAANAVYDFLVDLMEVQRAANNFDFFRSEQDRDAWFERLEAFFAAAGKPARPARR